MIYRIIHRTEYAYTEPVSISHHAARLQPRDSATQRCRQFSMEVDPHPALQTSHADYFGNQINFFTVQELHERLCVTSTSIVELDSTLKPTAALTPAWEDVAALFRDPVSLEHLDACQFAFDSEMVRVTPDTVDYARPSFTSGRPLLEAVRDLCKRIYADFKFDPQATTVATPLQEVLSKRRGVCQDFAHLGLACLRSHGLPARYISGYLRTRPPQGKEALRGADYSHAWFAVYCPGFGWVDFDPTNNLLPDGEHITLAYGTDFSDVSPLSGIILGGGRHKVKVGVDVEIVQ